MNDASSLVDLRLTSPAGRRVVVALAVGQALLLLLFHEAVLRAWPPFGSLVVRTVYLTLVIAVPTALHLLLDDPRRPRPWLLAGALAVALLPVALYTGTQALPAAHVRSEPIFWPYGLAMAGVWFVAVAFLQTAHAGRRRLDYTVLFHAGWYHLLTLAFAAFAVGLSWGVLALWDALFSVLGIEVFGTVFYDRRFVYAATGLAGGLGLMLARSYAGTAAALLRLLMTLLKGLLPLLAALALLFLAVLPFTGVGALWETGRPTVLMSLLVALTVLCVNGAFRDGPETPPYPLAVRRLVEAGVVVLPAYAVLSAYALWLRVDQYGWTAQRFWAALLVGTLGAFALAYAGAIFYRRRDGWMALLKPANTALGLALAGLLFLTQTPLLDPIRVAVSDQVERLRNGAAEDPEDVLRHLRFDSGARGYRALQTLQREGALRPALAARLDSTLRDTSRYGRAAPSPAQLRTQLALAPDTLRIPPALLAYLSEHHGTRRCLSSTASCTLLAADLHGDARREFILFRKDGPTINAEVYSRNAPMRIRIRSGEGQNEDAPRWYDTGRLARIRVEDAPAFFDSLRAGHYRPVPSQQRDLQVGRRRLRLERQ